MPENPVQTKFHESSLSLPQQQKDKLIQSLSPQTARPSQPHRQTKFHESSLSLSKTNQINKVPRELTVTVTTNTSKQSSTRAPCPCHNNKANHQNPCRTKQRGLASCTYKQSPMRFPITVELHNNKQTKLHRGSLSLHITWLTKPITKLTESLNLMTGEAQPALNT